MWLIFVFYMFVLHMLGPRNNVTVRRRQQTYSLFGADPMWMVLDNLFRPFLEKRNFIFIVTDIRNL